MLQRRQSLRILVAKDGEHTQGRVAKPLILRQAAQASSHMKAHCSMVCLGFLQKGRVLDAVSERVPFRAGKGELGPTSAGVQAHSLLTRRRILLSSLSLPFLSQLADSQPVQAAESSRSLTASEHTLVDSAFESAASKAQVRLHIVLVDRFVLFS